MKNSNADKELTREILTGRDPNLSRFYSKLSSPLSSRIAELVKMALPLDIDPDRLLKFAFVRATIEQSAQGDAISREHTRRSKLEQAGQLHGVRTGYHQNELAKLRYRDGRRACQQIQASLESTLQKWAQFEQVARKHGSKLPVHLQSKFAAELARARKALHSMGIVLMVDKEDLVAEAFDEQEVSSNAQTLIAWRLAMANYYGKWKDMHRLANAWRVSDAKHVWIFAPMVRRLCRGVTDHYPFDRASSSMLSEN